MGAVEGLLEEVAVRDKEKQIKTDTLFRPMPRRKLPRLPDDWLQTQSMELLKQEAGWVTVPLLEMLLRDRHEKMRSDSDWGIIKILENYPYLTIEQSRQLLAPSRPTIRRILDKLVREGTLQTHVWFHETGRPATVYYLPGRVPFDENNRCGQCVFYVSLVLPALVAPQQELWAKKSSLGCRRRTSSVGVRDPQDEEFVADRSPFLGLQEIPG
jgi:hypothetical protein